MYVPSAVFAASGVGRHRSRIGSFEMALRQAGIAPYNLVPVSSVVPPDADVLEPDDGRGRLDPGQVVHAVLARCDTDGEERLASAVGVARGGDAHGYAVERTGTGAVGDEAEAIARELVAGEPEESFAVTADGRGTGDGWTTAVAALVFVP